MSPRARACILVRHAHAEWPAWRGRDFDRPLTDRGLADARSSGRAIRAAGLEPTRIIASTARRTTQTALILVEELGLPGSAVQLLDSLYNADADTLLAALEESSATGGVTLLVAHNPGVSELARMLGGDGIAAPFRPADWRAFGIPAVAEDSASISSSGDTATRR